MSLIIALARGIAVNFVNNIVNGDMVVARSDISLP